MNTDECYKWLHSVPCSWCRPKTNTCTTHMPTQTFVSVIYCCHQVAPGIGIGSRYRYRSRLKVSVSEVSVNCGISFTLYNTDRRYACLRHWWSLIKLHGRLDVCPLITVAGDVQSFTEPRFIAAIIDTSRCPSWRSGIK